MNAITQSHVSELPYCALHKIAGFEHTGETSRLAANTSQNGHLPLSLLRGGIGEVVRTWQLLGTMYAGAEDQGGLLLHGGIAARGDEGILLLGPSGVGKTTSLSRMPAPWRQLCDDEAIVTKDDLGRYRLHSFPTWAALESSDTELGWSPHGDVSLKAVFILERCNPGETDRVEPFGNGLASIYVYYNCEAMWSRFQQDEESRTRNARRIQRFANACALSKAVPCFRLKMTRNGEFWTEIAQVL